MRMSVSTGLRQTQNLTVGVQMAHMLKVLALDQAGVVQEVMAEMESNPLLVPTTNLNAPPPGAPSTPNAQATSEVGGEGGGESTLPAVFEKILAARAADPGMRGERGGSSLDDLPPIEQNLTYGESLVDELVFQLHMVRCSDDERRAAEIIIQNLDDRGWLVSPETGAPVPMSEIASAADVSEEIAQDALDIVHELEPYGCGARNLAECLIIQAKRRYPEDDTFEVILGKHLQNLEKKRYDAIAKDLDIDREDVIEYHKMIQELDPYPGREFGSDEGGYIRPDVYVTKEHGEWKVTLSDDGIPELKVSAYYAKVLQNATSEEKKFLKEKLKSAEMMIRSIDRRRRTIQEVMRLIVDFQKDYFEHGPERLRPLTLQQVAERVRTGREDDPEAPPVGVHQSTVSRATSNKWADTPHGVVELKTFFTRGLATDDEDMSNSAVKLRVKQIIATEDQRKPLSDEAIATMLKNEGIEIARRTVAKYRDALGILPTTQRKKVF
jgi:RNA polymerase sigma-54 factor